MNQIKRITAFLLTFIMCLQVMAFSAFAADTSKPNLDVNRLLIALNLLQEGLQGADINLDNVYSKNQTNETLYIAENEHLHIEIAANKSTNTLNSLKVSLNISELNNLSIFTIDDFDSDKTAKDLASFSVSLAILMPIIDSSADYDTILDTLDILNTSSNKEYTYNNIKYTKTIKSADIIEIKITPIQQQIQPTPQPQNTAISVVIDGQPLVSNVAPQSINGRTMVPVRGIFEALGATVEWNATTKQVIATKGNDKVTLTLNSATAYINGEAKTLESPAISYNGFTLVPARFVAEAFGATVTWDNATKTVNIVSETKPTETVPTSAQPEESKSEPEQTTTPKQVVAEKPQQIAHQGNTVYVTKTGKKYHYDDSCNGGTYYASTLESAKSRGLTACDKCA